MPKAERREGTEQGKARGQRKQQWQHGIAGHRARQHQSKDRIDHAENDGVAGNSLEIFPTEPECPAQIGKADGPD